MNSSNWIVLAAVVAITVAYIAWRLLRTRSIAAHRSQQLMERQAAVQAALDRAGAVLKDATSSTEAGNVAASNVLTELHALNHDGSLKELIEDTEKFIAEWRTSRKLP